jgi:signal transduction histidine kinase
MKGVERVEQLDDRRLHWVADFGGSTHEWDAEITDQVPDDRIAWRSLDGRPSSAEQVGDGAGHHVPEERRRIERDLHDGAQQRLLALGLALERARAGAPPADSAALDDARERIAALRDDVRRIAHGIHSVTLAEGGLAEAVLALVQAAPGNVTVDALPDRRASAAAEAAVYRLVAACLPLGREAGARVAIHTADAELHAIIIIADATAGALTDALAHAGARIAALGGSLTVAGAEGQATANARVPAIP